MPPGQVTDEDAHLRHNHKFFPGKIVLLDSISEDNLGESVRVGLQREDSQDTHIYSWAICY